MFPRFSRFELEDIARYLDINHDGRIFYNEFIGRILIDEVEELNLRVADFIKKNGIDFEEALNNLDYRGDKCLNFDQFLEILGRLRLPLTRDDACKFILENPLHRTRDNRFSYTDLLERLPLVDEITKIFEQLRWSLQDKSIKVGKIFEKYNINNEESITPKMFFEAFTSIGLNLQTPDYAKLLESLPKSKDGKILYKEFIKRLKPQKKAKVVDIYKRLKNDIQSKKLNFMEKLKTFDTYNLKMMSKVHLKEILSTNSIPIQDDDIDFIWSELDTKNSGLINYEELFNKIKPKYKEPITKQKTVTPTKENHWSQRYLDQISSFLKENNMKIKELFNRFDKDHSNSVSPQEFADALSEIRVNIPYSEMRKLIDELISKDGQISLTSFEKLFPEYLETEKLLDRLYYTIRKCVNESKLDIKNLFSFKDKEMQGFISTAEFLDCIKQVNPSFTVQELYALADAMDPKRSNRIFYQDFVQKIELGGIELVNIKVREYLLSARKSFVKAFEGFLKNDYFLNAQGIRTALENIQLPLTAEEMAMLIHDNNLSRSNDGRLSVKDLAERIGVREHFPEPKPSAAAIYERIRKKWQENRSDPTSIFKEYDYEKDFHLTRTNFSQALTYGNCPLTSVELDVIWEILEKLPDGRASVQHFIRLVNGIDSSSDSIFLKIYKYCEQNKIDLGTVLQRIDTDNDRQISMFEMENALKSVKLSLTDHEYSSIFNEIDRRRIGRIYIPEFMNKLMQSSPKVDLSALQ